MEREAESRRKMEMEAERGQERPTILSTDVDVASNSDIGRTTTSGTIEGDHLWQFGFE